MRSSDAASMRRAIRCLGLCRPSASAELTVAQCSFSVFASAHYRCELRGERRPLTAAGPRCALPAAASAAARPPPTAGAVAQAPPMMMMMMTTTMTMANSSKTAVRLPVGQLSRPAALSAEAAMATNLWRVVRRPGCGFRGGRGDKGGAGHGGGTCGGDGVCVRMWGYTHTDTHARCVDIGLRVPRRRLKQGCM
jgi:hypothetical protein